MNRIPPRAEERPPSKSEFWETVSWIAFALLALMVGLVGLLVVLPELGW